MSLQIYFMLFVQRQVALLRRFLYCEASLCVAEVRGVGRRVLHAASRCVEWVHIGSVYRTYMCVYIYAYILCLSAAAGSVRFAPCFALFVMVAPAKELPWSSVIRESGGPRLAGVSTPCLTMRI